MTINQAAAKIGYHPEWIRELCRLGRIKATGGGKGHAYSISARDLRAFQLRPRKAR